MVATPAPPKKTKAMGRRGRPREGITRQMQHCIKLLLAGWNIRAIATTLDVSTSQIQEWKRNNPSFRQALDEVMNGFEDLGCMELQQMVPRAMEEISGCLEDPSPAIRLNASKLVLDKWADLVQHRQDQEVIKLLEARLEEVQAAAMANINTTPTGHLSPAAESVVEAQVVEVGPTVGPEEPGEDAEAQ